MKRARLMIEPPISRSGAKVRELLLEAAGNVFADKGFHEATSRDICLRANVNLAAVNYHFGGIEALYVATLKEAHRRVHSTAPFDLDGIESLSARERLKAVIRNLVRRLSQATAHSWEMRLVSRELFIPTFAQAEFVASSIEPQRAFLKSLVAEVIGKPADDPVVRRSVFTLIAPCVLLSLINDSDLEAQVPEAGAKGEGLDALIDHVDRFVLAGLDAVVMQANEDRNRSDGGEISTMKNLR